jgi:hypothetical protein
MGMEKKLCALIVVWSISCIILSEDLNHDFHAVNFYKFLVDKHIESQLGAAPEKIVVYIIFRLMFLSVQIKRAFCRSLSGRYTNIKKFLWFWTRKECMRCRDRCPQ